MEVTSTLSKTFKRFTIPRSTSSMGSFTTANGTATSAELSYEESTPPSQSAEIPPSNGQPSSHHKHPPLSYFQHMRPIQHLSQQNLTSPSQQPEQQQQAQQRYQLPARPLSGDISSFMIRSASTDFHPSNEIKVGTLKLSLACLCQSDGSGLPIALRSVRFDPSLCLGQRLQ